MNTWIIVAIVVGSIILIIGIFLLLAYLRVSSISSKYKLDWDKLDAKDKEGFVKLGWDDSMWKKDKSNTSNYPSSYTKGWGDLSKSEKEGAAKLGHYWLSWWIQGFGFPKK